MVETRYVRGRIYLVTKKPGKYMLLVFNRRDRTWKTANNSTHENYVFDVLALNNWMGKPYGTVAFAVSQMSSYTVERMQVRDIPKFLNATHKTPLYKKLLADPNHLILKLRRKRIRNKKLPG